MTALACVGLFFLFLITTALCIAVIVALALLILGPGE